MNGKGGGGGGRILNIRGMGRGPNLPTGRLLMMISLVQTRLYDAMVLIRRLTNLHENF